MISRDTYENREEFESEIKVVVFQVNGSSFGCDLNQAASFALYQELEHTPNLHITEFQQSLNLPVLSIDPDTRMILFEDGKSVYALPVTRINGVFNIATDQIFPLPPILEESISHPGLIGFGIHQEQIIILLDLAKTVSFLSQKSGAHSRQVT